MDSIVELPNEVICQFYDHLNPNDQLKLAATAKSIRDCIPDWKREHQKLFIDCLNQINEIKYKIGTWKARTLEPYTLTCDLANDERNLTVSSVINSGSLRSIGQQIVHHYYYCHSLYSLNEAFDIEFIFVKRGSTDDYNLDETNDCIDLLENNKLTSRTIKYRHTIYKK
jgi:hypothetical protein